MPGSMTSRKRKACGKCGVARKIRFFNCDKRKKDGLRYDCKLCQYTTQMIFLKRKVVSMKEEYAQH